MTYVRAIVPIILLLALSLGAAWMYRLGGQEARTELAEYKAKSEAKAAADRARASEIARNIERMYIKAIADIAAGYEKDKRDAEDAQRKLVADLRAGNVRLRKEWRGCETGAAATASQLDAEARAREENAAALVRIGRDADDWIKRLQEVVRKDRED